MLGNGSRNRRTAKIRYAVVGLGHIAQNAILPAFEHAGKNSELTALFSDDPVKLRAMGKEYGVNNLFDYADYNVALRSGEFDAVYVAVPNNVHRDYCVRAANAGIHVLCEKPLAGDEDECQEIIQACAENDVQLMTAYRLHFERGNLEAIELVRSGKIGEPRIFNSVFSQCIQKNRVPEPSGIEGWVDVHIIRSLYESAEKGRPIKLKSLMPRTRPSMRQEIYRQRVTKPKLVHVEAPSK